MTGDRPGADRRPEGLSPEWVTVQGPRRVGKRRRRAKVPLTEVKMETKKEITGSANSENPGETDRLDEGKVETINFWEAIVILTQEIV